MIGSRAATLLPQRNGLPVAGNPDVTVNKRETASAHAASEQGTREETLRHLFERYSRPVGRFFAARGFSAQDSRDLTQETFVSANRGLGRLRSASSLRTWLFSIARNIALNVERERATLKPGEVAMSLDSSRSDESQDQVSERQLDSLRSALNELPPMVRRCVLLRVNSKLSPREIGELLQIPVESVEAHLREAEDRLKNTLTDAFQDIEL